MIMASAGIIWTSRIVMMNAARERNRNRVTASAARNAKTSATTTVRRVTCSELARAGRKGARSLKKITFV